MSDDSKKFISLLTESIDHMALTPSKKEFAKAVLRTAIEYAAMREAGFKLATAVEFAKTRYPDMASEPKRTQ